LHEALGTLLPAAVPAQLCALYLLDLDGFKLVNDRLGHEAGDALLVAVAQRLRAQVRGGDVVARLGGDEFVVVVSRLGDDAEARRLGQKLLDSIHAPFDVNGQDGSVGVTIGYALAPLDGKDAGGLLKRADAAMYTGKQAGRHRLHHGGESLMEEL
jgi:diguanylate cyclase (GGDEF)-like protein